jgi:hypothetical protein
MGSSPYLLPGTQSNLYHILQKEMRDALISSLYSNHGVVTVLRLEKKHFTLSLTTGNKTAKLRMRPVNNSSKMSFALHHMGKLQRTFMFL